MSQLLSTIRRQRRSLRTATMPDPFKPLAVGEVCPHCGRVLPAGPPETNAETLKAETGNETAGGDARPTSETETPTLFEIPKPKKIA